MSHPFPPALPPHWRNYARAEKQPLHEPRSFLRQACESQSPRNRFVLRKTRRGLEKCHSSRCSHLSIAWTICVSHNLKTSIWSQAHVSFVQLFSGKYCSKIKSIVLLNKGNGVNGQPGPGVVPSCGQSIDFPALNIIM